MAFTYTNRKGQVYYLHVGKTKGGKPKWFMSTKKDGDVADAVPDDYEMWENPEDAQVFVRKTAPKLITDAEVELVRKLAREKAQTRYALVDVDSKGKSIVVYSADDDVDELPRMLSIFGNSERVRRVREQQMRYMPVLRFELMDEVSREFYAYRWCFLGSIDDWFPLDSGSLRKVAAKYLPHLGAESFFELM